MDSRLSYLRRRPNVLAVAGSLSLHVLGAALILSRTPEGGLVAAEGAAEPGSVLVTLVPAASVSPSASAPSPVAEQVAVLDRPQSSRPISIPTEAAPAPEAAGEQGGRKQGAPTAEGLQTASAASATGSNYRARLLAHIQPFRRYPSEAEAIAAHGVTQLIFRVDQDGNVMGVWIKSSSGFEALDNEAMATVLRAQPMPHVPAGLPSPLTVQLPVSFNPS